MKTTIAFLGLASVCFAAAPVASWNNGSGDAMISTAGNWQGTPGAANQNWHLTANTSSPYYGMMGGPYDVMAFDNGNPITLAGLTLNSNQAIKLMALGGGDTLTLGSEGMSFLGGGELIVELPFLTSVNQTWNVGVGTLRLTDVYNLISGEITINLSGGVVDFAMNSHDVASWGGTINFIGTVTATSIVASGTGFTSDDISKITINSLAVVESGGYLVAVPEASTYALVLGGLALVGALWRRRSA